MGMKQFTAVAKKYVDLVEKRAQYQATEFLEQVLPSLAEVIASALSFEHTDLDEDTPDVNVDLFGSWEEVFNDLTEKLDDADQYSMVCDPYNDKNVLPTSLADDLADIYRDLKEGLVALEQGVEPKAVQWEWHFGFWNHWGERATSALYAIRWHLSKGKV